MGEYDRRKDIEAEGQRATMTPNKPDLSRAGKGHDCDYKTKPYGAGG